MCVDTHTYTNTCIGFQVEMILCLNLQVYVVVSCGSEFMRHLSCYAIIYICTYNIRP